MATFFDILQGDWVFTRWVDGTMRGIVEDGQASFTPNDKGILLYHEEGHWETAKAETPKPFAQDLLYKAHENGFDVFFSNDKFYQSYTKSVVMEGFFAEKPYLCDKHHYSAGYTMMYEDNFIVRTIVSGPKKNILMRSSFFRPPREDPTPG